MNEHEASVLNKIAEKHHPIWSMIGLALVRPSKLPMATIATSAIAAGAGAGKMFGWW